MARVELRFPGSIAAVGVLAALLTSACQSTIRNTAADQPLSAGQSSTVEASPAESQAPKIGVRPAPDGAYPFQVALLDLTTKDDNGKPVTSDLKRQFCGGSLLDERHVLTAAHCFEFDGGGSAPDPSRDYRVVVGRTRLNDSTGQIRKIARYEVHPDRRSIPSDHDVAVITLDQPVTGISPVSIVSSGDSSLMKVGSVVTFTGWGPMESISADEFVSVDLENQMKEAHVPIVAGKDCQAAYASAPVPIGDDRINTVMCTGTKEKVGHCAGDSGGPLFTKVDDRVVQLGVVSFAQGCGDPRFPSVYARLNNGAINAFIKEEIAKN